MKQLKRSLVVLLACVCVFLSAANAEAAYFTDLNKTALGQETFDAIMYVSDNGIMNGTGNGQFSPNMNMTRAQIVQVLFGHSGYSGTTWPIPFTDVPTSAWYYQAVCWAYHFGIASGTSATTFSPDNNVNLEQTMCFLYRYATDYLGYETCSSTALLYSHSDQTQISSWARIPMNWALLHGLIIPPNSSSPLYPQSNVPRKDMALYACRFDRRIIGFSNEKVVSYQNNEDSFFSSAIPSADRTYEISSSKIYNRLLSQINAEFADDPERLEEIIDYTLSGFSNHFTGACFGNAMVMLLDTYGQIDFNRFVGNYATVSNVPSPKTSIAIRDTILYYQGGQCAAREYFYTYLFWDISSGLSALKTQVDQNGPTIFGFSDIYGNGHAIIAEKVELTNGKYVIHSIEAADPEMVESKNEYEFNVNGATATIVINGMSYWNGVIEVSYLPKGRLANISFLDIDLTYNNAVYPSIN